jgi:predicted nuclease of predicted toxin-antitoxin system
MRILLDENISYKLFFDFTGHQISTVDSMKWKGKKNGELLGLMAFKGFDVLITRDRNLRHQQNISKFNLVIILLLAKDNRTETVQPLIQKVKKLLRRKLKTGVIEIT